MTEAHEKGSKSEQPTEQGTPTKATKPAAEAKREARNHERAKRAEELLRQNKRPAGERFCVEDDYWEKLDPDVVRVREALGIDDDDFCRGIVRQLYQVTASELYGEKADFNFMLSVLKDLEPVDKIHAMLAVHVVLSQLALMRLGESLLKPITFELPDELISACHHAHWDLSRLDKQKIQTDDQPVREWCARMHNKLSQTFHMHLQAFLRYRMTAQPLKKLQRAIQDTPSMNGAANGAATMPGVLNGEQAHP